MKGPKMRKGPIFQGKIAGCMFDAGYAWHCADYKSPNIVERVLRFVALYLGFLP